MKDEPGKQDEQAADQAEAADEQSAARAKRLKAMLAKASAERDAVVDNSAAEDSSADSSAAGDSDAGLDDDIDALVGDWEADEDAADEPSGEDEGGVPSLDDVDVKDLLRAALKPPPARTSVIRRGVQDRIRKESRGRFFADGWSRNSAPKATFLVTTLLMLLLTLLAWAFLSPIGVEVFTG